MKKLSISQAHQIQTTRRTLRFRLMIGGGILLGSLLLWPSIQETLEEVDNPIPKIEVEQVDIQKKRVINPKVMGSDGEGQPYILKAKDAQHVNQNKVIFNNLEGTLTLKDQKIVTLKAQKGITQPEKVKTIDLSGAVHITYDQAYEAKTPKAKINVDHGLIYGENPVEATGPDGVTSAQSFTFDYKNQIITLKGNVVMDIFSK